jgi:hypothetical protein
VVDVDARAVQVDASLLGQAVDGPKLGRRGNLAGVGRWMAHWCGRGVGGLLGLAGVAQFLERGHADVDRVAQRPRLGPRRGKPNRRRQHRAGDVRRAGVADPAKHAPIGFDFGRDDGGDSLRAIRQMS